MTPFDTFNKFAVGVLGDSVVLLAPPAAGQRISQADALNLVAIVSVLARLSDDEVLAARRAVEDT